MKVIGIFRGFPGLGRVIAGTELLESLRDDYGCEVAAYSYLQGKRYLEDRGFGRQIEVLGADICQIGILPTSEASAILVDEFRRSPPDCFVIDGEPLLLQQLKLCFPAIKIVSLLNPSDLYNSGIHDSHAMYFRSLYKVADLSVVHGLRGVKRPKGFNRFVSTSTILRREIFTINRDEQKRIYCILGGGTVNVDSEFLNSTFAIAKLCVDLMRELDQYEGVIACACQEVAAKVSPVAMECPNIKVSAEYISPKEFYGKASLIITRAGRNTLSELAYLGIPAIAVKSGGRFRSKEQEENANHEFYNVVNVTSKMASVDFVTLAKKMLSQKQQIQIMEGNGRRDALSAIWDFLNWKEREND